MHTTLMISCDQGDWLASLHMTRAKESLYKEYEVLHISTTAIALPYMCIKVTHCTP